MVLLALCLSATCSTGANLTVTVREIPGTSGAGVFSLYDSQAAYDSKTPLREARIAVADGQCVWSVEDLPEGAYAIRFFFDANGNNIMDRNTLRIPREPVAFSNNVRPRFGPPRYSRMVFNVNGEDVNQTLKAFSVLGRRGRLGVGLGTIVNQSPYAGADARVIAIPMISYVGNRLFVAGPMVNVLAYGGKRTKVSATLQYRFDGFDIDESENLDGMHERGDTLMAGARVGFEPKVRWRTRVEVLTDVLGEHDGQYVTAELSRTFQFGDLRAEPAIGVEWMSSTMADHYYGVRPIETTADRPVYVPGDVFNPTLALGISYPITDAINVIGRAQWSPLDHAISDSPIVVRDSLASMFLASAYAL